MPICGSEYDVVEKYLKFGEVLLRKRMRQVYMLDEGDRIDMGGKDLVQYTVSSKLNNELKTAFVVVGKGSLSRSKNASNNIKYDSTDIIYVEKIPLPKPFSWYRNWPAPENFKEDNAARIIKVEFGIDITDYL